LLFVVVALRDERCKYGNYGIFMCRACHITPADRISLTSSPQIGEQKLSDPDGS
jgi:hypothetical protein